MAPIAINETEETQSFEFMALPAEMRDHILSQMDVRLLLFMQAIPECEQLTLSNLHVRKHLLVKGLPHCYNIGVDNRGRFLDGLKNLLELCGPMLESFRFETERDSIVAS